MIFGEFFFNYITIACYAIVRQNERPSEGKKMAQIDMH